jgi:Zn finger protein HypA/HybF involved in hydrogenase expression
MQPRQREGTYKQHAKFFCENCHHEVPFNAEICPKCKKMFSGVRCPVCQFSGPPQQFQNGCPRCGYQARPTTLGGSKEVTVERKRTSNTKRSSQKANYTLGVIILMALIIIITFIIYSNR